MENFYAYASVPGVEKIAGWAHHTSREKSAAILRIFIDHKIILAIEHGESRKVIGSLGLHASRYNKHPIYGSLRQPEVGYVLAKDFRGQGLIPEATKALSAHAFSVLNAALCLWRNPTVKQPNWVKPIGIRATSCYGVLSNNNYFADVGKLYRRFSF